MHDARVSKCDLHVHSKYSDRPSEWFLRRMGTPESFVEPQDVYRNARQAGMEIRHVKPHGALYNQAAREPDVAAAIARGVVAWSRDVVLVGLARSCMLEVWDAAGLSTIAEAFADRRYEPDGTLRARRDPDALITDPAQAADQARRLSADGAAGTVCVHSDTPNAPAIARAVRAVLDPRAA